MQYIRKSDTFLQYPSGQRGRLHFFQCPFCHREVLALKRNGETQHSCGCQVHHRAGNGKKHGLDRHPLYKKWGSMVSRCYSPSNPSYPNYGGRGIAVCQSWREDFLNFYHWALPHWNPNIPQEIDRIDNAGNYEPSNCRFTTTQVNSQNRRSTTTTPKLVRYVRAELAKGRMGKAIAEETGLSKQTVTKIKLRQQWQNIT